MSNPLISVDEIIARGDELVEQAVKSPVSVVPGALRLWYDRLYAERKARYDLITIADGSKIAVGKTYDLTIRAYDRHNPDGKVMVLHGFTVDYRRESLIDRIQTHKRGPEGREWQGTRRELQPARILSAVEVSA